MSGVGVFHTKSSQFGDQLQRPEVRGAFPEGRGARQQKSLSSQRNGSSETKGPLWEKSCVSSYLLETGNYTYSGDLKILPKFQQGFAKSKAFSCVCP